MWQCDEIREIMLRKLDRLSISLVERVVLTTRYDASAKLRERELAQLSARSQPLTIDDSRQLGIELTVQVTELRERIINRHNLQQEANDDQSMCISMVWPCLLRYMCMSFGDSLEENEWGTE